MYEACPFIIVGKPLLEEVKQYNRDMIAKFGSIQAARGELDLYTERYLVTYTEVGSWYCLKYKTLNYNAVH